MTKLLEELLEVVAELMDLAQNSFLLTALHTLECQEVGRKYVVELDRCHDR